MIGELVFDAAFAAATRVGAAYLGVWFGDKLWNATHSDSSSETAATPASNAEVKPNLVEPDRAEHIHNGDQNGPGGGHLSGTGKPGKSEFPPGWSGERILGEVSDVATDPSSTREPSNGRVANTGTRDGVDIRVRQDKNGRIVTGYPTNTPQNPGSGTP